MQLVDKTKASRLALSLNLSLVCAACLTCAVATGWQPSLAQDAVPKLDTPVKKVFMYKDASKEETDFEGRLRAEAIAAEARLNEAVQHYDASRVYLSGGNTEMAELELQAAIMDGPNIKAFHRDYCLVSLLRGHAFRAVAEAMMVVGLGDPIPLSEKQIEKLKNQGCKLHYRRGLELALGKKWKDAVTEFQWALEYRPNNVAVMRSMAFANASLGNIELAEKQYGSSFSVDPTDAYSHADYAFLLAETGKGNEALQQLQEAVKLQPKVAALHIDLGWMAEAKGKIGEAEGEFTEAIKLSPKHASLWTHLGKLLARQGKADQAAEAYKNALALDPSAEDAQSGLAGLKRPAAKSGANSGGSEGPSAGSSVGPSAGANAGPGPGSNAGPSAGSGARPSAGSSAGPSAGPGAGVSGKNQSDQSGQGGGTNQMPPKFIKKEA